MRPSSTILFLGHILYACHCVYVCAAERDSGPSVGPSMSLGTWLPWQQTPTVAQPAVAQLAAVQPSLPTRGNNQQQQSHMPAGEPGINMPSAQHQSCMQHEHLEVQRQAEGFRQAQSMQSRQQQHVEGHMDRDRQGWDADTTARGAADRRRRQCLLEIERELLRHSSSESEGGGAGMRLPNRLSGKRQKTACTGMYARVSE